MAALCPFPPPHTQESKTTLPKALCSFPLLSEELGFLSLEYVRQNLLKTRVWVFFFILSSSSTERPLLFYLTLLNFYNNFRLSLSSLSF